MENKLVYVKTDDVFTTSDVIAENAEINYRSVQRTIENQLNRLEKFGQVRFEITPVKYDRGTNEKKIYHLNEGQATLLITFLKNTDKVADFKTELVRQFMVMKRFILEKQTADWQQSRLTGKQARKAETDIITTKLIPHAESQGSKNAVMFYTNYSRLVNLTLGIEAGKRDNLPIAYIDAIRFMEHAIENIISIEVDKGTHYKEIYQICKAKCGIVKELSFLPAAELLAG